MPDQRKVAISLLAAAGLVLPVNLEAQAQKSPAPQTNQYPQQYPPQGPYPQEPYPGQYPPNQYPARLPGGVPIGIPVPEIKLPKKKPKTTDGKETSGNPNDLKISLASVEGTLRKITARDLILETPKNRILRFRLLAKTQFRDKSGQPIRDSLLQAGDRMALHVNADDPETALRVILQRNGTAAERAAAAKPVDEPRIAPPEQEDLAMIGRVVVEEGVEGTAVSPVPDDPRPTLTRNPAGGARPTYNEPDDMILAAREAASAFTAELPNFVVQQVTTRYQSRTVPASWRPMDVVTLDVASVDGKEQYTNVRINGRPTNAPVESTGAWSTGEFVVTLQNLLTPMTNAKFTRRGPGRIATRQAIAYDFSVEQQNSSWNVIAPDKRSFEPAFTGTVWIDEQTKRVLRIEQKAKDFPRGFGWDRVESSLEYGYVMIDGKSHLLPVESENSGCEAGTVNCARNTISFRNYRKFGSDSKIIFDNKFQSTDTND